ncbi:alpha/beta hydrolase [Paenibacillus sp. LC231]|uniref:alpha/beta fold hydrolase n=1 Tax=Paenibacillus sp. LC231 TaxID=1120679 RepID=UPI0008DE4922|nr:alpha/beta hydrolase [Paenibacillus sp. LC231]OIB02429.1 alpha/beta hydrolase [Paenibacillus sp. LC231]
MKRFKSDNGQKLVYESYDRLMAGWTVPYEQHHISTSYGMTHVITAGSSDLPPLLLLHGTGDNVAMMWIYNVAELSRNFHIIAVDNIGGSGKSEPNDRYAHDFNQAKWLDEILEAMNVDATYIAGVSYGAYLAYHYAIVRPDRVRKIVCLAGGIAGSQSELMSKMMRAFLPEALFPSERSVRKLLRKLCGTNADAFENHTDLMQHWFYLLKHFNNRSMMKHTITIHSSADIQTIRSKTLFVIGEQDLLSYYPKAVARLEANGMRYRLVPGAGHAINHEMPDLVHEEIIGFCKEA